MDVETAEGRMRQARLALVEEHIRLENDHDLEGVMGTYAPSAR